jgi:hypothetical protein
MSPHIGGRILRIRFLSRANFSPGVRLITTTSCREPRAQKEEGSIAAIFTSLTGEDSNTLPQRFSDLKKGLWKDSFLQSWKEILCELEEGVEEISRRGADVSTIYYGFACAQTLTAWDR